MKTSFVAQADKYQRHGSAAVMPVCLWDDRTVLGST
jgi:hypothetical protein